MKAHVVFTSHAHMDSARSESDPVVAESLAATKEHLPAQLRMRAEHPTVNDALIAMAGLEAHRLGERRLEALFVDAERRVRRRLLELGEQYRDPETDLTVIPLAHEEIAQLAGTSRVTVSRVLSQEQRDGTIASGRRTIAVLDVARLKRRAEWPDDSVPAALRGT